MLTIGPSVAGWLHPYPSLTDSVLVCLDVMRHRVMTFKSVPDSSPVTACLHSVCQGHLTLLSPQKLHFQREDCCWSGAKYPLCFAIPCIAQSQYFTNKTYTHNKLSTNGLLLMNGVGQMKKTFPPVMSWSPQKFLYHFTIFQHQHHSSSVVLLTLTYGQGQFHYLHWRRQLLAWNDEL